MTPPTGRRDLGLGRGGTGPEIVSRKVRRGIMYLVFEGELVIEGEWSFRNER